MNATDTKPARPKQSMLRDAAIGLPVLAFLCGVVAALAGVVSRIWNLPLYDAAVGTVFGLLLVFLFFSVAAIIGGILRSRFRPTTEEETP